RAAPFKRVIFRFGLGQLEKGLAARQKGERAGLAEKTGRLLTGRWVLDKAGLLQVRYAGVTCAPVADDLLDWFWQLGLPLRELYSQVEMGGVAFAQRGVEDAGTTGVELGAGIEARVEDGELHVRAPGLLAGRLGGEGGGEVVDGWFATGDLAELDGAGRLV